MKKTGRPRTPPISVERKTHGKRTFKDPAPSEIGRFNLSRFHVDENGCHVWDGALNEKGYAVVGTNKEGVFRVSRIVYIRDRGAIPAGMMPDHLCRNRACINSAHIELVSNAENTRRGAKAKLNWEKVREIRRRYAAGNVSHRGLAAEYGVASPTITNILNNKRWREGTDGRA